ncbi:MAG: hypothetical protein DME19_19370 [Verrucomicrobia bacterium]|nr:MAG: hypothetical protein DME19_19370 [Verrucomicrobiota bacterium]
MQPFTRSCASRSRLLIFVFISIWLSGHSVNAILFYSSGDPNYNTSAPGGSLTNSGWQYQASWGGFLGTPIAPNYFITASHVYVPPGTPVVFRGVSYTTLTNYDDPASDLRIWRICGTFPDYAPIYTNTNETGNAFVVIGRGTQRGPPVTTTNFLTVKTNGWQWGAYDAIQRWGTNVVAAVVNGDGVLGNGLIGEVLQATFDANGGNNECHLSFGDSGGAVFIKDASIWKLAGINLAVDGPYNTTNTNGDTNAFNAAIFDATGLYEKSVGDVWVPASGPGSFYATRVSAHVSWINSVINANVPPEPPVLQSAASASGPYADETNALVDDASRTITTSLPGGSQFYRLRTCGPLTIQSIQVQGGNLVLTYQ